MVPTRADRAALSSASQLSKHVDLACHVAAEVARRRIRRPEALRRRFDSRDGR
jgi:hypothetical protein